jgi:glutathione S-transferase
VVELGALEVLLSFYSSSKGHEEMSKLKLYGITFSPWTYKARWALEWHRIPYDYSEYAVMMDKLSTRIRLRHFTGSLTVPAARIGKTVLLNSLEIASYADRKGEGKTLLLDNPEVLVWDALADEFQRLGRYRLTKSFASDPLALKESLPGLLQRIPGSALLGKLGVQYMLRTYPVESDLSAANNRMREILLEIRKKLEEGDFLIGEPSYADMAIAAMLQMVDPVGSHFIPLKPSAETHWRVESLAEEFRDLCVWRDRVFERLQGPTL